MHNFLKKILKQKFLYLLFFVLILEIMTLIPKINKSLSFDKILSTEGAYAENIFSSNVQKYLINSKFNNLSSIKFIFGTYKRKNTEILEFNLYNSEGKVVRTKKLDTRFLVDNQENILKFKKIKDSKNKNYFFEIKSLNGTNQNSVAVYRNSKNIVYDLGYQNLKGKFLLFSVVFLILVVNVFIMFYFLKKETLKKEKVFLALASVYCFIALFIVPPFAINDENFHFYKTYALATGQIKRSAEIPTSVVKFTDTIGFSEYINNHGKINLLNIKKATEIPLSKKNIEKVDSLVVGVYNPISYIPQVISIFLASLFNLSIFQLFYFGRIITLLIWITIVYIAIKNAPDKIKNILLIISLLPSVVQESFPYSTDVLINSSFLLFISFFFKLYLEKDEFNWKYGIIFFLGVFMPIVAKITYLLVVLLILIIPKEKFKNRKEHLLLFLTILIPTLLISFLWSKISPSYIHDTSENLLYIKSHPIKYLSMIILTTKTLFLSYVESAVGILGWYDTRLPFFITGGYICFLGLNIFSNNILKRDFKFSFISMIILLGTYVGVLTALFVAWTPLGSNIIEGVQGRYFIILLPILSIFLSRKALLIDRKKLELNTNLFLNFGLAYTMLCIIERFYI